MAEDNNTVKAMEQRTENTPTEVIGLNQSGKSVENLSALFEKMEQGTNKEQAIEQPEKQKPQVSETVERETAKQEASTESNEGIAIETNKEDTKDIRSELLKKAEEAANKRESEKQNKEEKKTEEKKPEQDQDITDDELKVLPHDKPKTAKRIQALLKKIDSVSQAEAFTKKELESRDAKLKELQSELEKVKSVDPTTNQEIKKQLDELTMFRRKYQLENDPEVKTKFDSRIDQAETTIYDVLKKNQAGDGLINLIKEEGGWMKFASSNRQIQIKDPEDGEVKSVPAYQVAESILGAINVVDRKMVDVALVEQLQTKREKDRYFEEQQKNAAEYFKKQEEQSKASVEAQRKMAEEAAKAIDEWQKKTIEQSEWLKEKQIPEGATPEQKAAIEEDNIYTNQIKQLVKKNLEVKDLNGMLDIVKESAMYWHERRENAKLASENAKLKAELEKAKSSIEKHKTASRTTVKTGSISASSVAQASSKPTQPRSLEEALAMREEGRLADGGRVVESDQD